MKGLYQVQADWNMLARAIDAGIDTILVPFYDLPDRPPSGLDTWEQNVATCESFAKIARIIAVPVMFPHWCDYPIEQRFIYHGQALPKHFCPTNRDAYESIISPFRDLIARGLVHEVVLDVEHYPVYVLPDGTKTKAPEFFKEKISCECPSCSLLGWEGQWKFRELMTRENGFVTGQTGGDSWWSVNCLPRKRVLTQGTYEACDFGRLFGMWKDRLVARLFHGCKMTMVPGAFPEVFRSTDDFIKYLGFLSKHFGKQGYWIYSQMNLTKNCTMSIDAIENLKGYTGFYDTRRMDERDPDFFGKLKKLNG
jgi:hypothetical protein